MEEKEIKTQEEKKAKKTNKLLRIICGLGLVLIAVFFMVLREYNSSLFSILISVFMIVGTFEMVKAFKDKITIFQKILLLIFAIIYVPVYELQMEQPTYGLFIIVISASVLLFSLLIFDKNSTMENLGISHLILFYPTVLLSPMLFINNYSYNSLIALLLVFTIGPLSDVMAYFVGSSIGGKKLCPTISPNKTIAGAIGGLIGGMVASLCVFFVFRTSFTSPENFMNPILFFIIIGIIGGAVTIFGDLIESIIKRKIGIKDMGKILPGHGGILDRIDGMIFTSCFIFAIFGLFIFNNTL